MSIQSSLNSKEILFYFMAWTMACSYSLYNLYKNQEILLEEHDIQHVSYDFQKGWSILDRPKDISDFEWSSWKHYFKLSVLWFFLHFIIAEILRYKNEYLVPYWYICVSITYTILTYGYVTLLFLIMQPLAFSVLLFLGAKRLGIWVLSLFFLLAYSLSKWYGEFSFTYVSERSLSDEDYYIILASVSWITMRCISFSFDYVTEKSSKILHEKIGIKKSENIINYHHMIIRLFSYCFYFPLLFCGPVILYDSYKKSFEMRNRSTLYRRICLSSKHMTCYMGWYIFTDWMLHFFYFGALQNYVEIVNRLPSWAFYGGGLWMGLFFHLKYVVMYGITCLLATMDHMDAPPPPRCIARIHLYSHMWKYFDVGLYKFLVRYVYKPILIVTTAEKIPSHLAKTLSTFFCFFFVYFWHGMQLPILVWTILNFLGIILENVGVAISKSAQYNFFVIKVLKTEPMAERFKAFGSIPLLLMSALSNFFFFGGYEIGLLYVHRVFHQSFLTSFLLFSCLYSCCHISTFLSNVPARTIK